MGRQSDSQLDRQRNAGRAPYRWTDRGMEHQADRQTWTSFYFKNTQKCT